MVKSWLGTAVDPRQSCSRHGHCSHSLDAHEYGRLGLLARRLAEELVPGDLSCYQVLKCYM